MYNSVIMLIIMFYEWKTSIYVYLYMFISTRIKRKEWNRESFFLFEEKKEENHDKIKIIVEHKFNTNQI